MIRGGAQKAKGDMELFKGGGGSVTRRFFDRHQCQMMALALYREGQVSCLRDREREERSEGRDEEEEECNWEGGE